ncbi:uncharacterized protein LOC126381630 [Pectinophora gossypiella]|uniref:uncharacterized protein LOC126381630 n=1 Tax=Pectinophora gossypiella TaxID=13191 RepID=UPI00214ED077|nr:uncharacterized protein LOC126381630 [Pectinophora gossypiella]
MEACLKRQIVNAAEAVKKKVKKLRNIETENEEALKSVFRPIINPLNKIANKRSHKLTENGIRKTEKPNYEDTITQPYTASCENVNEDDYENNNSASDKDYNERSNDSDNHSIDLENSSDSFKTVEWNDDTEDNLSSWSLTPEDFTNVPYGVRNERGKLMLGTIPITIGDKTIKIDGNRYTTTPGLIELLYKKNPDLSSVTEDDKKIYKSLLLISNAHRRDYDPKKPINGNKDQKLQNLDTPKLNKSTQHDKTTNSE